MSMRYPGGLIATTPVNQQYPSGVWTGPQSAPYQANNVWGSDPFFKNTTLLLHGDGATTSFTRDASTNNFQVSLAGDTKPNNLTPFVENGYWSNAFDGSGDYLTLPNATTLAFSTNDFTVEGWFNFSSNSAAAPYNQFSLVNCYENQSGNFGFSLNVSTSANTLNVGNGDTNQLSASFTISVGTWYHIAVSRSGGTIRLFVNGVLATSAANTTNFTTSTNPTAIGALNVFGTGYTMAFNGFASNVRIVKGTGLYTSNFTPSTTPLTAVTNTALLTCQSNRFVDNSTNAYAVTRNGDTRVSMQQPFTAPSGTSLFGSGYFDGSGDYLTVPDNSNTEFGSGDFTVECWAYYASTASTPVLIDKRASTGGYSPFIFYTTGGTLVFYASSNGSSYDIANGVTIGSVTAGQWYHVAASRSGTSIRLFLNGVLGNTVTSSAALVNNSDAWTLGGTVGGNYLNGYLSNVRFVKGTALYTAAFTPPTTPLTPVTNTSLLTLQTNGPENNNGFLDSSLNSFPITRNGNTTQGSLNPYQTTGYWSNAFDGSGDYLTIPSSSTFSFTGDFTWEAWVYLPVTTSGTEIVSKHLSGVTGWYMLSINSSLNVNFVIWNDVNASSNATTSGTVRLGQWNHVAGGRNGSTVFACLNGAYTSAALTVTPRTSNNSVNIGINLDNSSSAFNGYMSNLRCVSSAVYTGNYTVPTAPLTAIANTQLLICQSNRFKDNSANNVAITSSGNVSVQNFQPFTLPALQYTPQVFGGSGYFDGSGDYLTLPVNPAFDLGLNACCVEAWVYLTNNNTFGLFATSSNTSGQTRPNFYIAYNQLQIDYFGNAFIQANITVTLNSWHHAVFTRASSSGPWRIFLDGVLQAYNATGNQNLLQTGAAQEVGRLYAGTTGQGYMCDLRITNGSVPSAYVTSSTTTGTQIFTPPTAPLGVISNTVLLLPYTNAAIFDNSGMNNLETVGNAQIDTSVVKYGASSMYFDGSGDYLVLNSPGSNIALGLGAVDFTVEFWVYFNSGLGSDIVLYDGRPLSTNGVYPTLYVNSSSRLSYVVSGSDRITSGLSFTTNTWYHVALARFGTTTKMFINGTQVGSNYTDSNNYLSAARRPVIAINGFNETAAPLNGYIDDLRVTKGVARYVTNFTPPVARMPNQ